MSNLLAVSSSLIWGVSDYVGGVTTRWAPAPVVVFWSQALGLFAAIAGALLVGGELQSSSVIWGSAAGVGGAVALVAFYQGLASGRMAVVAPIAALVGAGLPVVVGLVLGERPRGLTLVGMAIALPAIWLVSRVETGFDWNGLGLALTAGVGFGLFFVFLGQAPDDAGLWPLVPARIASVLTMAVAIMATKTPLKVARKTYPGIAVAGVGDMLANMLFLLAVQTGLLSVVSVLASLYPAVTVILAWSFGERVTAAQWSGVGLAIAAAAFIAL